MKHTKGPWVAAIDPGITTVDNNKCKVFSANSSFFAIIDGCEYSEGTANARLIAAAPEMLEALEEIATGIDSKTGKRFDNDGPTCRDIAGKVLAKLKGEVK